MIHHHKENVPAWLGWVACSRKEKCRWEIGDKMPKAGATVYLAIHYRSGSQICCPHGSRRGGVAIGCCVLARVSGLPLMGPATNQAYRFACSHKGVREDTSQPNPLEN